MRAVIELTAICVVSILLVIFVCLYFTLTKRHKKLKAVTAEKNAGNNADNGNINSGGNGGKNDITDSAADIEAITAEWAEQLQIIQTQIDLMCELSPVFIVCYDYGRECFSMSENGQIQLGLAKLKKADGINGINGINGTDSNTEQLDELDEQKFEELIHPDDMFIYEEVTGAENIRKAELAESPYVIRLRHANAKNPEDFYVYNSYLTRIKPVYSETGISAALVIAFINTDYLEDKNKI